MFEFRSSNWLEIQIQLEIRLWKYLNFDIRAGSKFKSSSKFAFETFWISIFELARNSNSARNWTLKMFEFWFSSWLEIQIQLVILLWKCFNFDLRADSKFKSSSKFDFETFWISIFKLARNSSPARNWISIFDFRCQC